MYTDSRLCKSIDVVGLLWGLCMNGPRTTLRSRVCVYVCGASHVGMSRSLASVRCAFAPNRFFGGDRTLCAHQTHTHSHTRSVAFRLVRPQTLALVSVCLLYVMFLKCCCGHCYQINVRRSRKFAILGSHNVYVCGHFFRRYINGEAR